jgi:hypothetical protein
MSQLPRPTLKVPCRRIRTGSDLAPSISTLHVISTPTSCRSCDSLRSCSLVENSPSALSRNCSTTGSKPRGSQNRRQISLLWAQNIHATGNTQATVTPTSYAPSSLPAAWHLALRRAYTVYCILRSIKSGILPSAPTLHTAVRILPSALPLQRLGG